MLFKNLIKFVKYFVKDKKSLFFYCTSSFIVSILELLGVALIYPFVLKLLNSTHSEKEQFASLIIGVAIILLFLIKNLYMIGYNYFQAKYIKGLESGIKTRFMQYFLTADYQKISQYTLAQKINLLNYVIPNVISNFALRILNLNINLFIFCGISAYLIVKYPLATLVTSVCACLLIYTQTRFFKFRLKTISEKIAKVATYYSQNTNEPLINYKSVKISNNEGYFLDKYKAALQNFNELEVKNLFYNSTPPYITEPCIIIILFTLLTVIYFQNASDTGNLIASFAVIASAIFRMAPAISRIQTNLHGINSVKDIVNELIEKYEEFDIKNMNIINSNKIEFENNVELKNVYYKYNSGKLALKDISLTIKKGEFIGITGRSGAGKTTLADIIAGLLQPTSGKILADGQEISASRKFNIGYIPQELNIVNDTIRANVAYGTREIDDNKVIDSLKKAQIYEYIQETYPNGIYENPFIDNIGLSQGQKQRLILARALYNNPDILILDEATSALDIKTEDEICHVLKELKTGTTIIAIAHRLSTIKSADKIILLDNGKIADIGHFEALINRNTEFKSMAELSSITTKE